MFYCIKSKISLKKGCFIILHSHERKTVKKNYLLKDIPLFFNTYITKFIFISANELPLFMLFILILSNLYSQNHGKCFKWEPLYLMIWYSYSCCYISVELNPLADVQLPKCPFINYLTELSHMFNIQIATFVSYRYPFKQVPVIYISSVTN